MDNQLTRSYEVRPVWTVIDEDGAYTDVTTDPSQLTGDVVSGYCVFNTLTGMAPDNAADFHTDRDKADEECLLYMGISEDELIARFEGEGYDFNMSGIFDQDLFDSLVGDEYEFDQDLGVWHFRDESNPGDPYDDFPLDDDELDHDPDAQMPTTTGIHEELDEIEGDDGIVRPEDDEIEDGPLRLHFPHLED